MRKKVSGWWSSGGSCVLRCLFVATAAKKAVASRQGLGSCFADPVPANGGLGGTNVDDRDCYIGGDWETVEFGSSLTIRTATYDIP